MENNELIENYEKASSRQLELLKEILTRYQNRSLTDEQWERVRDIASRQGAYLFDTYAKDVDKREIKKSMDRVIDMCTDENR